MMDIIELPVALESVLQNLDSKCSLSSWDVHGKGQTTTLVLRWDSDSASATEKPEPVAFARYRRKSPSELRRDTQRAATRQHQVKDQQFGKMVTPAMVSVARTLVETVDPPQHDLKIRNRSVTCSLKFMNTTKFPLIECYVKTKGGELHIPPSDVGPGTAEIMVARKTAFSLSGTYGTVSWNVEGTGYRLVIMWHCPWDFIFHDSNWLGIGVIKEDDGKTARQKHWFDVMFTNAKWDFFTRESWRQQRDGLDFESRRFYNDIRPLSFDCKEGGFQVEGMMSNDHNATARITVEPLEKADFAPDIIQKLETKGY